MAKAEEFIKHKIAQRVAEGSLRELSTSLMPVDFCSNDYLGFATSPELRLAISAESIEHSPLPTGSGGSRLLSGNTAYAEETEKYIAKFHNAEAGLIFNSGYDANIGLLSSLGHRGDTFICDELIHASLIDGVRLTHASRYTFKHNDLQQLEDKLKHAKGIVYVVVESVYSMNGDLAPLLQIATLCNSFGANLIVDEAHATGVIGTHGRGLVQSLHLEELIFARIATFGKAIGCHGAIVLGSKDLRQYLINFARSFIYTTAAPLHNIIAVNCAYRLLEKGNYVKELQEKVTYFSELATQLNIKGLLPVPSAIQTITIPGNQKVKNVALKLQSMGFDVRPILSPTVAIGAERLRICLHLYNTEDEIEQLLLQLKELI
jgi:8-amino-7-oxononanoate synthase